jgi:uncharacterized protein YndB with AHSA1/START domain
METVFRFLVEPQLMSGWIGSPLFSAAEEGGLFCLQFTFGEGHTAAGVFTEVSPPHRVAFSFGWDGVDGFPAGASLVEIGLSERDGGTVLHLRHSGFPQPPDPRFSPDKHDQRWSMYLSRLADAVNRHADS